MLGNISSSFRKEILQHVILGIFSGNLAMFAPRFGAGLDEDSFFTDTATKSSLELFRDKAAVLGAVVPKIRATLRRLKLVFMQEMDVGLRCL